MRSRDERSIFEQYAYLLPAPDDEHGWLVLRVQPRIRNQRVFISRFGGWTPHPGEGFVCSYKYADFLCTASDKPMPVLMPIPTNIFWCEKCGMPVPWDFGCALDDGHDEWCDACWAKKFGNKAA